ncbi:aminotransferase class IV [Chloroflexota bacterium]
MEEKVCYFRDEYIKESEAKIHISDWGLWEGGIYEVGRTYNGAPFKMKEHIERFFNSIRALPFMKFALTPQEVAGITLELLKRNGTYLDQEEDTRFIYRLTRGILFAPSPGPTFYVYLGPLLAGAKQMAKWYQEGAHMVVASTRQIPPQCLDPKIKHTNRLCNHLAEYEAQMVDPEAFALMLDINGFATECPRDNFFMLKDGKLLTSRLTGCLPGITRQTVIELAEELKIECAETDLCVYHLYNADEIMITGTSFAIIPVSKFNEKVLPKPIPGAITKRLQSAFSERVDYDIVQRILSCV